MVQKKILLLILIVTIVFSHSICWSLKIRQPVEIYATGIVINPIEFAELPEYLQARVKYHDKHGNLYYSKWHKIIGVDYIHLHHWAAGIVKYNRALKVTNKTTREFLLGVVVGEYNYLLRHCTPKFKLRYLFHYSKGVALFSKGDIRKSVKEFMYSLRLKKTYIKSYLKLSEAYIRLGMVDEANKIIEMANKIVKEKKKADN